jgi:ATP-dependent Clp protease ATP-binding subunit ClpB
MAVVRASFRPEFLNRVDEIILFHRLKRADMAGIVAIQLKRLEKLLEDRRITIDLGEDALGWLSEKGYDPAYGARPLKRVIQQALQDQLAEKILSGEIHDGMNVRVHAGSDRLVFQPDAETPKPGKAAKAA